MQLMKGLNSSSDGNLLSTAGLGVGNYFQNPASATHGALSAMSHYNEEGDHQMQEKYLKFFGNSTQNHRQADFNDFENGDRFRPTSGGLSSQHLDHLSESTKYL